ncbi:hypothetical protein [Hymenobacter sp. CRA2]|uniref:hypothetical protein n=1 Tax=Hymenobacter sp. CRA2 TaxID=1955620 RepID=UPI0011172D75|nr:hypothetical protein [Hymenobacter sp. CRA2]
MAAIREQGSGRAGAPRWRQLLGIFTGQLVGLSFIGLGLLLDWRGVHSFAYPSGGRAQTGTPVLLYLLGAGLMLLFLAPTAHALRAWRRASPQSTKPVQRRA